jgi:hypothetical protein
MHLQEFARIGNSVYQDLMTIAKQRADYAPPIYDQPDPLAKPKKSKRTANKKSEECLAALKKFFNEKTHPLPDKEPIRIFFADIPSYRALYKKYKLANPKGSAHFFSWATWNYYRRSRFPWVKVRLMVVSLFLLILTFRNNRRRRLLAIRAVSFGLNRIDTGNGRATPVISPLLKPLPKLLVLSL